MPYPDSILHQVMLPNGTFKTTEQHRLDDLNDFSLPFLQALSARPIHIMDVAASSGSTTAQWRDQLRHAEISCKITATDKMPYAYQLKIAPGVTALVDSDRNPLHFTVLGRGVSPRIKGLKAPVKIMLRVMLKTSRKRLANKVALANEIAIEEDDLLAPSRADWIGAFDVIRAANIVNRAYFDDASLISILARLRERLRDGGLLIIARTGEEDGRNRASIVRGSQIIARLNGGSDVEDLIARSN